MDTSSTPIIWTIILHSVSILGVLLTLLLVSQILRSPRMPAATMGWIIIIILVPIIGIPLYLSLGIRKLNDKLRLKTTINLPTTPNTYKHPVHSLLVSLDIPSSTDNNQVAFHANGKIAFQQLINALESAQKYIDIAIFILQDDEVGKHILQILAKQAEKGVRIRLLLDGLGCFKLSEQQLHLLKEKSCDIAWFIPLLHRPLRGKTNLRNHRKIVIIDQLSVWSGGRNFTAEYLTPDSQPDDQWVDLSFSIQGSAVSVYLALFEADWQFATHSSKPSNPDNVALNTKSTVGENRVQVIPSGPDVNEDPIYAALLTACYEAERVITLVTPYYIPDDNIQTALKLAALRGIEVDLILPKQSNHKLADIARNRYLRELHKAGVSIWLYPKSMIHAKAFVFDPLVEEVEEMDKVGKKGFAMAGSANLDIRSLFLNYEVMSGFYSQQDIQWLANWLGQLQKQSAPYQLEEIGYIKELWEGVVLMTAYQL